ncbi:MAG TPA: hypothetical protein ENH82_11915, partial [bacterium]|nr:hypothetical protein [bacterium]
MVKNIRKIRERRDTIIDVIVSTFLETGEPISSGYVTDKCCLGLSPATIRNIMKELEEEGLLTQPHISSGRIPTVKCYRYYVNRLMPHIDLTGKEFQTIKKLIESVIRENDADVFVNHIASVLSEVTDLIGVSMSPLFECGTFDRLEIVNIGGSRYLLVISLKDGLVKTINLTVDKVIQRTKIEETARLLTNRLHGLTVSEIKRTIGKRIKGISGGDRKLFDVILNERELIFNFSVGNDIHVAGLS